MIVTLVVLYGLALIVAQRPVPPVHRLPQRRDPRVMDVVAVVVLISVNVLLWVYAAWELR